jgi:hypothetical protein
MDTPMVQKRAETKKILLGIMALCFVASVGHCQDQAQPLKLTIKSDKQVYAVGEEIWIHFIFKNISKEPIELLIWNGQTRSADNSRAIDFPMHHRFEFLDEHGKAIASVGPNDIAKRPVKMERKIIKAREEFVSKVPLHTWKLAGLGKGNRFIGSEARKIQIKGSYMVPVGIDFAVKDDERIFLGQLDSNTIAIEVKENKAGSKEDALKIAEDLIKTEQVDLTNYKLDSIKLLPRREADSQLWNVIYSPVIPQRAGRLIIFVNERTGEAVRSPDE